MLGAIGAAWHPGNPEGRNATLLARASLSPTSPRDLGRQSPHYIHEDSPETAFRLCGGGCATDGIMASPASSLARHIVTSLGGALSGRRAQVPEASG